MTADERIEMVIKNFSKTVVFFNYIRPHRKGWQIKEQKMNDFKIVYNKAVGDYSIMKNNVIYWFAKTKADAEKELHRFIAEERNGK